MIMATRKKQIKNYNEMQKLKRKLRGMKKSLTIWLNTAFSSIIVGLPIAESQLPSIKPYIPSNAFFYISAVIVVANVLLRFKTCKGLDEK